MSAVPWGRRAFGPFRPGGAGTDLVSPDSSTRSRKEARVREFHNPVDLLKNVFSPPKIETPRAGPSPQADTRDTAADEAAEKRSRAEAADKARAAAAARTGRRQSVLTPTAPASQLPSGRRSLLGSSG